MTSVTAATSLLFVPGDRPDRFDKAAAAGAGAVIVDLEDAVGEDDKDTAREHVRGWLAGGPAGEVVVRVNAADTPWHDADLAMAAALGVPVMLPKAQDPEVVARVADAVGEAGVVPLVETARGVVAAVAVCAVPGVLRPAFGNVDLAGQLGVDPGDRQALLLSRLTLVLAAASAGIAPPLDGVTTALRDEELLRADLAHAVSLGFGGKLCIHPSQVAVIGAALRPSEEDVAWARRVVATEGQAVAVVDGAMIDRPVLARAKAVLARAGA